jgi:hypothetical protein
MKRTLEETVDELGRIKARIANLTKQEEELRQELIAGGVSEVDGKLFHATISKYEVALTDWQTIAEKLSPSRQLVTAHTKIDGRTSVKVFSRASAKRHAVQDSIKALFH